VTIPAAITAWGGPLLSALARAVGVPGVAEVWIRYGDDGTEERLTGGRASYRALKGADDSDVVLVVGSAIPLSRTMCEAGSEVGTPLPDDEQWYMRLTHLVIKDTIPKLVQKVRLRPALQPPPRNICNHASQH